MRKWLIALRKRSGLSQADVAHAANISQPSYCDIELGKNCPKPLTAKRIAAVLNFDWTEFFKETA